MSIFDRITQPRTALKLALVLPFAYCLQFLVWYVVNLAFAVGVTPNALFSLSVALICYAFSFFVFDAIKELFKALKNPGIFIGLTFSAGLGYLAYHVV